MRWFVMVLLLGVLSASGCSSSKGLEYKRQKYASLPQTKVFEDSFEIAWRGIEDTFKNHKVTARDPEEADPVEMKKLTERSLETDWIYSQSRDKYVEYKVNQFPRKRYLQVRFRYLVKAKTVIGGTEVTVLLDEEIEDLQPDGTAKGYQPVPKIDTSRANEILEKITLAVLSSAGK